MEERISEGKPFNLYKFRTFKPEALKEREEKFNIYGVTAIENKKENLTRVGRFLKKFYFDELPQMLNIIKGEMCFVGPRPLIRALYEDFKAAGNLAKDELKAGLTGPWQIRKGQIATKEEIVAAENAYLRDVKALNSFQRLVYDLKIIARTFRVIREAKSV